MPLRRLTRAELKRVELSLIQQQDGRCPLCSDRFGVRGGPVVDHCHSTGAIRAVLCRTCNGGEGKVKTCAVRYGRGNANYIDWLENLAKYLRYHEQHVGRLMYPSHKTDEEKRLDKNKKARLTRAKLKGT